MEEEGNGKTKPDIENKIKIIKQSIRKIEDIFEGKTPVASDFDLGNKRILNSPPPRDPAESAKHHYDPDTAKYLYVLVRDFGKRCTKRF